MAAKKWFVLVGDEEMGPLGPGGLHKLVDRGELKPETMMRREDREEAIPAHRIAGLFPRTVAERHGDAPAQEEFSSLRPLGWTVAGVLVAWALIGVFGVLTALDQHAVASRIADGEALPMAEAGAPFLGIGGVFAAVLFLTTGVLFVYWLWLARANLPALILARHNYAQAWTVAAWLVPVINLLRPYQVMSEIDRLTAEAHADGNAAVRDNPWLLGPWWLATLALVAVTAIYRFSAVGTGAQLVTASVLHVIASVLVVLAAVFASIVVARITELQERSHKRHAEPVRLHHEFRRRRKAGTASA